MFLEYETKNGRKYALRPSQIRTLEGTANETRIWASIAGLPVTFTVQRPYDDVLAEIKKSHLEESEQSA